MFARLKQVTVPTLVIQIADDQVINQRTVAGIAGEIPGSEFVSIEGRNHVLLEDEPAWPQFLRGCLKYRESLDQQLPNTRRTQEEFQAD